MPKLRIAGVYAIIDPDACRARAAIDVARMAIEGGASVVQWRDKRRPPAEQTKEAAGVAALCRDLGAIFIANDSPQLAADTGADGVHLGQDDASVADARRIAGDGIMIGVSTNNAGEAQAAVAQGADYVAIGAIFPTGSKSTTRPASLERVREVKAAVRVPVVAIGGIGAANIRSVIDAGADAAAVISAICGADDPRAAAAELAAAFPAAGDAVTIALKHGSEREAATAASLRRLLRRYDLRDWQITADVVIEQMATPHSHPVLTLNTRHPGRDDLLLATYLHEQIHWQLTARGGDSAAAIAEIKQAFPSVAVGGREGAADAGSSYLHVLVNYLEWRALVEVLGATAAERVIAFWMTDHYTAIYALMMDERERIGDIARRHHLAG